MVELLKCHIPEFKLEFMIKRSKYTFIVAISIETLCVIKFKKRKRIARLKKIKINHCTVCEFHFTCYRLYCRDISKNHLRASAFTWEMVMDSTNTTAPSPSSILSLSIYIRSHDEHMHTVSYCQRSTLFALRVACSVEST